MINAFHIFAIIGSCLGGFMFAAVSLSLIIDWDIWGTTSKWIHFVLIFVAIGIILINILGYGAYEKEEIIYDEIISIEQDQEMAGVFVLGTGGVNEKTVYYMYAKTERGLILHEMSAGHGVYIIETNEVVPHITLVKEKWKSAYYIIYVPEGTILKEYKL